jgi:predicted RNA-binding Zn-ribbon protein involved in translation (DUF1610 family)
MRMAETARPESCPRCGAYEILSLGPDGLGIFWWLPRKTPSWFVCMACGRDFRGAELAMSGDALPRSTEQLRKT